VFFFYTGNMFIMVERTQLDNQEIRLKSMIYY